MIGFRETITFNEKELYHTNIFADSYIGGQRFAGLRAKIGMFGSFAEIIFDDSEKIVIGIIVEDNKVIDYAVYLNAENWTVQELYDMVLSDYSVSLENWEIVFS